MNGKGFGEQGFSTKCLSCGIFVTHDVLSTYKLVQDLIACHDQEGKILAYDI